MPVSMPEWVVRSISSQLIMVVQPTCCVEGGNRYENCQAGNSRYDSFVKEDRMTVVSIIGVNYLSLSTFDF